MPVKWVKNSVKFTATPDYPNAIYICNTSGQTYSLVTILEVDEEKGSPPEIRGAPLCLRNF